MASLLKLQVEEITTWLYASRYSSEKHSTCSEKQWIPPLITTALAIVENLIFAITCL